VGKSDNRADFTAAGGVYQRENKRRKLRIANVKLQIFSNETVNIFTLALCNPQIFYD
jgi:hypothetical protein